VVSVANANKSLPPFEVIEDVVGILGIPLSASELHGILCGYLCTTFDIEGQSYLKSLYAGKDQVKETFAVESLLMLFDVSAYQIQAQDFKFQLLLPDDDEPLWERAKAFGNWCNGFNRGFTSTNTDINTIDDETKEALFHISEFSEIDYQSLDIDEDDEKAFMEVSEYVRMAVLMVHAELNTEKGSISKLQSKAIH
jgi:uncharacterized protein